MTAPDFPNGTCREFLGEQGWCAAPARVLIAESGYCGPHAIERQRYAAAVMARATGRVSA